MGQTNEHFSFQNVYRKNAARAAPIPANAGAMTICAPPVASEGLAVVCEDAELEADLVGAPVTLGDWERVNVDPVAEALLGVGVAAAEALGSKSPPAVMTTAKLLK